MNDKLEPMPEPFTTEPELHPGGVDAIPDLPDDEVLGRDLDPDDNPAVDDALPPQVAAPDEDKKQAPEGEADDQEAGTERSPEAGQEAEDGSVEPPA
ncbi:hypothetical protein EXE58_11645 [Nocardioides seonyuensis]|uniref:Uncharacterized protein n=1 Tax=Nocardioides seonyuensis TaxID=2518371 RepID=A0A4P7IH08_9ACTN|nr:hypothetical protein [Nocardioides seonyuensis]QBX56050.1 hypothetical protein EXE58_11645 [Nocardioides seonyuensis]